MDKMKISSWDKSRELFLIGGLGIEPDTYPLKQWTSYCQLHTEPVSHIKELGDSWS